MGRFAGRVVIVTGAASGIGQATARRLGDEGATVACLDVADEAAAATAEAIRDGGAKAVSYHCDVSDAASVRSAVGAAVTELGAPHVLCNIAGIGRFAHTIDQPLSEWERIVAVNLTGTFSMCQACLPYLLDTGGNIVNTASSAGLMGQPYSAAYCASKGGVVQLTRALASEYIERGVRVNAIAPGGIDTPLIGEFAFPEGANVKLFDKILSPMGFAKPEEVAGLFAFVASDEARYMTGAILAFDGGITG